MKQLENISMVLVEPSHPGNIGAVARSMKTMGLNRLILVNPKKFPHYEASKRAAGAESVLLEATVVDDLSAAIEDCSLVLGTSVRDREVSWPTLDPEMAASNIFDHFDKINPYGRVSEQSMQAKVAILFGRESSGLANEELDRCQAQIRIPANDVYSSLNLASAVQIISYELRMQALRAESNSRQLVDHDIVSGAESSDKVQTPFEKRQGSASVAQREGHLKQLEQTLIDLDFVKTKPPTMLMRKLTRLYNKAPSY